MHCFITFLSFEYFEFTCNHIINEMAYIEDATVYHIYFGQA